MEKVNWPDGEAKIEIIDWDQRLVATIEPNFDLTLVLDPPDATDCRQVASKSDFGQFLLNSELEK